MAIGIATSNGMSADLIIRECAAALRPVAEFRLPAPIDRRLLWLSENKEILSEEERQELLALADMAEVRTLDRVRAQALLQQIADFHSKSGFAQP